MRKTAKLAAVTLAAVSLIGASASVAAADNGDTVVTGSNCKYAQGDVIVIYRNGCSAVSNSGSDGGVTVSDGSKRQQSDSDGRRRNGSTKKFGSMKNVSSTKRDADPKDSKKQCPSSSSSSSSAAAAAASSSSSSGNGSSSSSSAAAAAASSSSSSSSC